MRGGFALSVGVALLLIIPAVPTAAAVSSSIQALGFHSVRDAPRSLPGPGAFAFVANFEDGGLDGWSASQGSATVVSSPSYAGEPALLSTSSGGPPQVDVASEGFAPGGPSLSFQAAIDPSEGSGWVGVGNGSTPLAVVGLSLGTVWAGPNIITAAPIGSVTAQTAQPAGWVWVSANIYPVVSGKTSSWVMDVYVDRTDVPLATMIPVPQAAGYTDAWLSTTQGTVEYTDFIYTSYQIATTIPGYNNMDGYGQGSGLLVSLLPEFTTLSARMVLDSWSTPQTGILSFQINAMNYYGTTRSTCKGFFQLGVDLNPNGTIAPWYVPGDNCVAHYFTHSNSPAVGAGFPSPPGSTLFLTIADLVGSHRIVMSILDTSVSGADQTWVATIPYTGTEFFGTYTQIEWQPCCSNFPIGAYSLDGSLDHMAISGGNLSGPTALPASYMLPFALDVPTSWAFNYYNVATGGYEQIG